MSFEGLVVDLVQGSAAALGAGVIGSFGWLVSKLWAAWQHEIGGLRQTISENSSTLVTALQVFQEHSKKDLEVQGQFLAELRALQGYIRGREEA